jgi:hypothetical protein
MIYNKVPKSLTKQADQHQKNCSCYTYTYLSANTIYLAHNKGQGIPTQAM